MPSECCKNILVVNVKSLCTYVVLKRSVIWSNLQFFDTERPQPKEIGYDFLLIFLASGRPNSDHCSKTSAHGSGHV